MNTRLIAVILAALASASFLVASTESTSAPSGSLEITTVKHTSVHIGPMSFTLREGTKLDVLGRQGDSLVVKFRNSKGTIRTSDTNFNAKTMNVPEIAPEARPAKSADIVLTEAAEATHANGSSPVAAKATKGGSNQKVAERAPKSSAPEPAKHAEQPVYYPPVNN
ncbi:MAG TPA: hypothetical protein VG936_09725 [Lacunisphaera sp.]|nr:hypothetical protein [Lacunisphaera sp.]